MRILYMSILHIPDYILLIFCISEQIYNDADGITTLTNVENSHLSFALA